MQKTLLRTFGGSCGARARGRRFGLRAAAPGRQHRRRQPTAASRRRRCRSTSWRRSSCTATARSRPPTAALPPILEQIMFWFDKNGEVETRGLPVCTDGKLVATTTAAGPQALPAARSSAPASAKRSSTSPNRARSRPLADHDLQRPPQARQPDRVAHAYTDGRRAGRPSSSRSRSRGSTTAATASRPSPTSPRSPTATAPRSTGG